MDLCSFQVFFLISMFYFILIGIVLHYFKSFLCEELVTWVEWYNDNDAQRRRNAKYNVCVNIVLTKWIPILRPNHNILNCKAKFIVKTMMVFACRKLILFYFIFISACNLLRKKILIWACKIVAFLNLIANIAYGAGIWTELLK